MSFSFVTCILIFSTSLPPNHSFVLPYVTDNINNIDSGDMSVDFDIDEDDYEMIDQREVKDINVDLQNYKHLERIGNKEHDSRCIGDNGSKVKIINAETDKGATARTRAVATFNPIRKGEITIPGADHQPCKHCKEGKLNEGIKTLEFLKDIFSVDMITNCTSDDASGIGIRAILCLMADYNQNRQPYSILAVRLLNTVIIWMIMYLVVAIPLWCTKGWCCCCLYCKFFKPQETIQEAKNYLLLNPPGVLVTKKGAIIHYEPTEREKDYYEEFGHFIRTL